LKFQAPNKFQLPINKRKQKLYWVIGVLVIGDYLIIEIWLLVIGHRSLLTIFDSLYHFHLRTPKDEV